MLFSSWIFAVFIAVFAPLYLVARNNLVSRNALLLVASYVFYGWWDSRFLILVALSTAVDYCAALGAAGQVVPLIDRAKSGAFLVATTIAALVFVPSDLWIVPLVASALVALAVASALIERTPSHLRRALWLSLSLVVNLGVLVFFKYFNFLVDSFVHAFSFFGGRLDFFTLKIILPVGLSFYTFQAISRTIDSYRGQFAPQRNLLNYAAFHAFFPQLVAGPIERAAHLMPQFERLLPIKREMVELGLLLFLWGLYKKIVIADNVAPFADTVFRDTATPHTSAEIVLAVLAFSFQIYGDFSGYSDMARGIARCMGFDLMVNFNLPYFSCTPSEFWRRWHISLSSWLRDYLYIPLGGNRGGDLRMYRNLMVTMGLGGLWHGASWTFVIWGLFHGLIQIVYRVLGIDRALARSAGTAMEPVLKPMAWLATMALVMVGWIFFRSATPSVAWTVLSGLAGTGGYAQAPFGGLLFYVLPLVVAEAYQRFSGNMEFLAFGRSAVRYHATLAVTLAVIVFGASGGRQFIYFDF